VSSLGLVVGRGRLPSVFFFFFFFFIDGLSTHSHSSYDLSLRMLTSQQQQQPSSPVAPLANPSTSLGVT